MLFKHILTIVCLLSLPAWHLSAKDSVTDTLGVMKAVAQSPASLMRGEISGVRVSSVDGNPNGALNVYVRGLNTLRGDSQPLWIVDGAVIGSSSARNLDAFFLKGGTNVLGNELPDYSGRSYTSPLGNFGWLNPYEIESIEVIKDMSAASLYGMAGANGVVIINTRKVAPGQRRLFLNSNVGVSLSTRTGEAFHPGFLHSHDIGISGTAGGASTYGISGFLRQDKTPVRGSDALAGGLAVKYETQASNLFKFGFNSFLSYGENSSFSGTNYIGAPSLMILSRYPDSFADDTIQGWLGEYDDEAIEYRTVNSVWLQVNFLKELYLKVSAGLDYENQTRYFWYGAGTSFGKDFSGADAILNNSLLNYNARAELNFSRNFFARHHLEASVSADILGKSDRTNSMCGTDFDFAYIRGKGISSSGSLHAIRKYARTYLEEGLYGKLGYDYDGLAGFNAAIRVDRNGRFDKKPLIFPSGEAYVNLHKLLPEGSFLSALRIEGGYGVAAHETVLPYELLYGYIPDVPVVESGAELYFDGLNRLISKEFNVALSVGINNDRYKLSVKYYDKSTADNFRVFNFGKVVATQWQSTANWVVADERESAIRNNGIEADMNLAILEGRDQAWTLYGNVAWNMNRIVSLDPKDVCCTDLQGGNYLSAAVEGLPVGYACGYETDGDGRIVGTAPSALGNTIPKVSGGLGTTFRFKALTLDAKFSGAAGFKVINANPAAVSGIALLPGSYLEDGDFLRLEHLSASYSIPFKTRWLKELTVRATAHNLFTLTGYSGWNPDVNSFGVTARAFGVDYGSFPMCRSFVLGLSVKF